MKDTKSEAAYKQYMYACGLRDRVTPEPAWQGRELDPLGPLRRALSLWSGGYGPWKVEAYCGSCGTLHMGLPGFTARRDGCASCGTALAGWAPVWWEEGDMPHGC